MNRLNDRISKKLRGRAGETIAETLIAVLIAALALILLAGAITASSAMITKSRKRMEAYYAENEKVVTLNAGTSTTISITGPESANIETNIPVVYYKNDTFTKTPVIGYIYKVSTTP